MSHIEEPVPTVEFALRYCGYCKSALPQRPAADSLSSVNYFFGRYGSVCGPCENTLQWARLNAEGYAQSALSCINAGDDEMAGQSASCAAHYARIAFNLPRDIDDTLVLPVVDVEAWAARDKEARC